jgi:hypothetical protein
MSPPRLLVVLSDAAYRLAYKEGKEERMAASVQFRRRDLMLALGGLALGPHCARALEKMTRQQAQYQDEPKGMLMCGTCSLFVPPKACKVVEGDVAVTGWCNAFDLAD